MLGINDKWFYDCIKIMKRFVELMVLESAKEEMKFGKFIELEKNE